MDITPFIGPVISALCAFAGSWLALSTRLVRVEEKVDSLRGDVNKHNEVIERTYKLEQDVDNMHHRLTDIRDDIHRYHP